MSASTFQPPEAASPFTCQFLSPGDLPSTLSDSEASRFRTATPPSSVVTIEEALCALQCLSSLKLGDVLQDFLHLFRREGAQRLDVDISGLCRIKAERCGGQFVQALPRS